MMFRNYLSAALRNLVRNRLFAAINIIGLAVGFAAALVIALYVRDEISYDTWVPGHERTYAVRTHFHAAGGVESRWYTTNAHLAQFLELDFPSIEETARLFKARDVSFRRGEQEFLETFYWADASLFRVLPLPA